MRHHLFQKLFGKMVKIKEMSFPSTKGMYLSCHGCMNENVFPIPKFSSNNGKIGFLLRYITFSFLQLA